MLDMYEKEYIKDVKHKIDEGWPGPLNTGHSYQSRKNSSDIKKEQERDLKNSYNGAIKSLQKQKTLSTNPTKKLAIDREIESLKDKLSKMNEADDPAKTAKKLNRGLYNVRHV